jgi:hypothetical protein
VTQLVVVGAPEGVLRALLAEAPGPLSPDGCYCAAVSDSGWRGFRDAAGWSVQAEHEGVAWLLAEADDSALVQRLLPPDALAGIGQPRRGLAGARRSVVDAGQAFALSSQRGVPVRFSDEWVAATLVAAGDALDDLCATALDVARRSPHLADAVLAFAEQGLSVVGAGRALHVHANTVIYRLERWQHLTGWDARTFDGLSRSVAALTHGRVTL